jgi:DNA-directed RNA polymerase specialized sigma24 family protein
MASDDWQVFRNFQYRSTLMTYVTVVAVRFFQKKRAQLIDLPNSTDLNDKTWKGQTAGSSSIDRRMDIQSALQKMPNARYRKVIEELDLNDVHPEELAKKMNVTIDNLYNIHRRAHLQLRLVMGRKEEYV